MKKITKTSIIILLIIILSIASIFVFYSVSRNHLRTICNSELEDYAIANAATLNAELTNALKTTQTACNSFVGLDNFTSKEALQKLQLTKQNSSFENMILCDKDGKGINSSGGVYDCTKFNSFEKTRNGESKISSMELNNNVGQEIIVSAPIIDNGKVIGMLFGIYSAFDVSKIINVKNFNGQGYATLIDTKGNSVIPDNSPNSLNKDAINCWEFFKTTNFEKSYSLDVMKDNVQNNLNGLTMYSVGDEHRELYYTPLGINDWYLLQMVTSKVVNDYTMPMNRMVLLLIAQLTLLGSIIGILIHKQMDTSRKEKAVEAERFRMLAENIPAGVAEFKISNSIEFLYANDGFYKIIGYNKNDISKKTADGQELTIYNENEKNKLISEIHKQVEQRSRVYLEQQIKQKNGLYKWISVNGKVVNKEKEFYFMQAVVTDITEQKNNTEEILENAKRDKMTKLYDKVSATEIITKKLSESNKIGISALLVIDIDDFKQINDTFGHQLGDVAIEKIAETIRTTFRASDIKGRIGGDEFVVFMNYSYDNNSIIEKANDFIKRINLLELDGTQGVLSCSVGGVIVPCNKQHNFNNVFKIADENLYHSKCTKKGTATVTKIEE